MIPALSGLPGLNLLLTLSFLKHGLFFGLPFRHFLAVSVRIALLQFL